MAEKSVLNNRQPRLIHMDPCWLSKIQLAVTIYFTLGTPGHPGMKSIHYPRNMSAPFLYILRGN